jgi:hypothetical protein
VATISHLTAAINASTAENNCSGSDGEHRPSGCGVERASARARVSDFVQSVELGWHAGLQRQSRAGCLSTSRTGWETITGYTFDEIVSMGVNGIHIVNQNNKVTKPVAEYFWLRDSTDVRLRWLWAHGQRIRTFTLQQAEGAPRLPSVREDGASRRRSSIAGERLYGGLMPDIVGSEKASPA